MAWSVIKVTSDINSFLWVTMTSCETAYIWGFKWIDCDREFCDKGDSAICACIESSEIQFFDKQNCCDK